MVSDGCTAWVLSDWLNSIEPIQACCVVHDQNYLLQVGKTAADWDLMTCVAHAGFPIIGAFMGLAVAVFGGVYYRRARRSH